MAWPIIFEDEFDAEYKQMDEGLQEALLSNLGVLEQFGPQLGRPKADTLYDSEYANMKELRFNYNGGIWRVAYAFDTSRQGTVLVAGNKSGEDQKLFYKQLITTADRRFSNHLKKLKDAGDSE